MGLNKFSKSLGLFIIMTAFLAGCSKSGDSEPAVEFKQASTSNPELAGKVSGEAVTLEDLDKNLEVFQARVELFNAQKKVLEEMARKKALEKVASKKNLSVDQYLEKESANAEKAISESQLNAFLKKMNADPSTLSPENKKRARTYVHMQNVIAAATKGSSVELYIKRPKAPKLDVNLEGEAIWGKKDAPVTIVEFSDFQCPFCSRGNETIEKLKKEYGTSKIKVVFKHYPLPMHPEAKPASEASLCVNEQSSDKFWKFHDLLFANQQRLKEENLMEYAKKVGVDMKKFEDCFKSKKYASHVEKNMAEGQKLGVDSTPSFFVNGQPIRGARPIADFKEIIDEQLSQN